MPNQENETSQITVRNTAALNTSSEYKPHPIKTRIMANVLSLTQVKKYQIGGYELNEPDYLWMVQTYENFIENVNLEDEYWGFVTIPDLEIFVKHVDPEIDEGRIIEIDIARIWYFLCSYPQQDETKGIFETLSQGLPPNLETQNSIDSNCKIQTLNLSTCHNLKELNLNFCSIKELILPKKLDSLKKINLFGINYSKLDLSDCKNLENIEIIYCVIDNQFMLILPKDLTHLRNLFLCNIYSLETLDLSNCDSLKKLILGYGCVDELILPYNLLNIKLEKITTLHCTTKQKKYLEETNQLKNVKEIIIIDEE